MSVLGLARPELLKLTGYSSARMEASGGRVLLNANESPWSPLADGSDLNRYPEPQPADLLERLADLYGVPREHILVGRGSDEAIDLVTRAFCRAGRDQVIVCPPTFGMVAVAAAIQGAGVIEVPLRAQAGFEFDFAAVLEAVTENTRLVYACNPNNPTGNALPAESLRELARRLRDRALLLVDEAYIEFSAAESLAADVARHDNLLVLRTLSKAHGLASARIGVALADPQVIGLLRRIMAPYPLPGPSVQAALSVLSDSARARTRERITRIVSERERLASRLASHPMIRAVLPASGNFLCLRCVDAPALYAWLKNRGILVRSLRGYPALSDALRISIGTESENQQLITALDQALAEAQ